MFALRRRAIGVSVALVAAASLTATLLISTALAQDPPPSITSITVSDITMTTARVTVNLAEADDGTTVYLKFGSATVRSLTSPRAPAYNVGNPERVDPSAGRWVYVYEDADPLRSESSNGAATFNLPDSALPPDKLEDGIQDLWASYEVLVEASLDDTFTTVVATETFMTLPPEPRGGWFDATKTAMGILTWLSNLSGTPHTIYYRWRAEDATTWITGSFVVPWGNPQTDTHQVMTGLVSHTPYVMELSLDPNFLPADETVTDTGWTREPDVVRMGIRKVTETEATVTAVMDHPNGKDYNLECQSQLDDAVDQWSSSGNPSLMDGYVGAVSLSPLTATTDYGYQCHLEFNFDPYVSETDWVFDPPKYLRTLGTAPALTEISGSLSGTTATITVDLVNTDGSDRNIYLRHRQYPTEQWNSTVTQSTITASTEFTLSGLADDAVHEIQAGVEASFLDETTLTLFLAVGNPPYTTVPDIGSSTPIEDPNNGGDTQDPNNGGDTQDPNNGGDIPPEETNTGDDTPPEENNNNGGDTPPEETENNNGGNENNGGGTLPQNNSGRSSGGGFGDSSVTRNTAPKFRDSAGDVRTVPENSEEGVKVGKPIMAWDPENDVLAFSLRGDDAEPFTIDEKTGQILVGPEAVLDYEAQKVHVVTLVVTDPGGEETTTELEIHLTDVKLPGKADIFDVANNHNERLEKEEVEAAAATYGLGLITKLEILFIVKYYYSTELAAIDFDNLPSMVDKYDVNADSIIDRDEVLTALQDFMEGRLSRSDMREVLKVYYITVEEEAQEAEPAQT